MSRAKMTEIDGGKLGRLFEVAGVNLKDASVMIGKDRDYLREAIKAGRIAEKSTITIEALWNIRPEDYLRRDAEEPRRAPETITEERLKEIIADAILEALKRYPQEAICSTMQKWRESK